MSYYSDDKHLIIGENLNYHDVVKKFKIDIMESEKPFQMNSFNDGTNFYVVNGWYFENGWYLKIVLHKTDEECCDPQEVVKCILSNGSLSDKDLILLSINDILLDGKSANINYTKNLVNIYGEDYVKNMSCVSDDDKITINSKYLYDDSESIHIDIDISENQLCTYNLPESIDYVSCDLKIMGYFVSAYVLPVSLTLYENKSESRPQSPDYNMEKSPTIQENTSDIHLETLFLSSYLKKNTHGLIFTNEEFVDNILIELDNGECYFEHDIIVSEKNIYGPSIVIFSLAREPLNGLKNLNYDVNHNNINIRRVAINGEEHEFMVLYYGNYHGITLFF